MVFHNPNPPRTAGGCLLMFLYFLAISVAVYFLLPAVICLGIGFCIYLIWASMWAAIGAGTDRRE